MEFSLAIDSVPVTTLPLRSSVDFKQPVSIDCSVLEIEINLIRQLIEADNGGGQRGHIQTHSYTFKTSETYAEFVVIA